MSGNRKFITNIGNSYIEFENLDSKLTVDYRINILCK